MAGANDKLISQSDQLFLYKSMKRIRLIEEAVADRYHEQEMRCPVHLSIGQEAVPAVTGLLLDDSDFAVSTHRSHGHYLGKGGSLKKMIAEFYGKAAGCSSGKGGSMHLIDQDVGFMGSTAIVAGTIPVGVGLGLSLKLKKSDRLSTVFLGEGATEEGPFYESINFAALKNLPVLFICENNLYSVYSSLDVRQPQDRKIYKMVEGMGMKSDWGDGNDVCQIYNKLKSAITHIRSKKGPYFIEFFTYRWREHCGPNYDNDTGYRTEDEFLAWKMKDPIKKYEKRLLKENILSQDMIGKIENDISHEITDAFSFALQTPFPEIDEIYTDLYKED